MEPLAALADPEAQAAFMQERLSLAGHAVKVAVRALSWWVPAGALWPAVIVCAYSSTGR